MHVCSLNEEIAREVDRIGEGARVAAARRLVLLRRLEWSSCTGRGTEDDPISACCPECRGLHQDGHADGCELGSEVTR
jgi:hypothetical protein